MAIQLNIQPEITKISDVTLKNFLSEQFSADGMRGDIPEPFSRTSIFFKEGSTVNPNLIALYMYQAPIESCYTLLALLKGLSETNLINLIKTPWTIKSKMASQTISGFYAIYRLTPSVILDPFLRWLSTLSSLSIRTLLTDVNGCEILSVDTLSYEGNDSLGYDDALHGLFCQLADDDFCSIFTKKKWFARATSYWFSFLANVKQDSYLAPLLLLLANRSLNCRKRLCEGEWIVKEGELPYRDHLIFHMMNRSRHVLMASLALLKDYPKTELRYILAGACEDTPQKNIIERFFLKRYEPLVIKLIDLLKTIDFDIDYVKDLRFAKALIQAGFIKALAYWLESQPVAYQDSLTLEKQVDSSRPTARSLLQANIFIHHLKKRHVLSVIAIKEQLSQNPGLLTTRWYSDRSLAHLAIEYEDLAFLKLTLDQNIAGEIVNAPDAMGLTPLDYAIKCHHNQAIILLLEQPVLHIPTKGIISLIAYLLICDDGVGEKICLLLRRYLLKNPDHVAVASFFKKPFADLVIISDFNRAVEITIQKGPRFLRERLLTLCRETRQISLLSLYNIALCCSEPAYQAIQPLLCRWLLDALATLSSVPAFEREKKAIPLIVFLFSLSQTTLSNILQSMFQSMDQAMCPTRPDEVSDVIPSLGAENLKPADYQKNLSMVLATALTLPFIYSQLDQSFFDTVVVFLNPVWKKNVAMVIFLQGILHAIDADILLKLSSFCEMNELVSYHRTRDNDLVLTVICMKRYIADGLDDKPLWQYFEAKLSQLLSTEPTLILMQYIFNLITEPSLKVYLTGELKEPLIEAVVQQYRGISTLNREGFLRDVLYETLCRTAYYQKPANHAALMHTISSISYNDVCSLFKDLVCAIETEHYLTARESQRDSQKEITNPFLHFMSSLKVKTAQMALMALYQSLSDASDNLMAAFQKEGLHIYYELAEKLSLLAEAVMMHQFSDVSFAFSEAKATLLGELSALSKNALLDPFFLSSGLNKRFTLEWPLLIDTLYNRIISASESALLPSDTRAFKEKIQTIHHVLKKGLLRHNASAALFIPFLQWQKKYAAFISFTSAMKPVFLFKKELFENQEALRVVIDENQALLNTAYNASSLLKALDSVARKETVYLRDILDVLIFSEDDALQALMILSHQLAVYDMYDIVAYISHGREQGWNSLLFYDIKMDTCLEHINVWLQGNLKAIQKGLSYSASVNKLCEAIGFKQQIITSSQVPIKREAILLWMTYFGRELQEHVFPTDYFIRTCYQWIEPLPLKTKTRLLDEMPPDVIAFTTSACLQGLIHHDMSYVFICRFILKLLCLQSSPCFDKQLPWIRQQIGSVNLALLQTPALKQLAQGILSEKNDLNELTIDGVCIQYLVTSVTFMAAASDDPLLVMSLLTRYEAISSILKMDEYHGLTDGLNRTPHQTPALLKKREQAANFRATYSIQALLNQLEQQCHDASSSDEKAKASKALNALYTYYHTLYTYAHLETPRGVSSTILQLANALYCVAVEQLKALADNERSLFSFLEQYCPGETFASRQLRREDIVYLYNQYGQKIARLDQMGYVFSLSHTQQLLLDISGWHAGYQLYDDKGLIRGVLTEQSQLQSHTAFEKKLAPTLLSKMPVEALLRSEAVIDLLLKDVLLSGEVACLFNDSDMARKEWLKSRLQQFIQKEADLFDLSLMNKVLPYLDLQVLLQCELPIPLRTILIQCLLIDAQHYALLHDELIEKSLQSKRQLSTLLAWYLVNAYEKPHFRQGFARFNIKNPYVLIDALRLIHCDNLLGEAALQARYDTIMGLIFSDENSISHILQQLFGIKPTHLLSDYKMDVIQQLMMLIDKQHIIALLRQLAHKGFERYKWGYRLILCLFHCEEKRLLGSKEHRFSSLAWDGDELEALAIFTVRHMNEGLLQDPWRLVERLLSNVMIRCANFGRIAWLYDANGRVRIDIINHTFQKTAVASDVALDVADKFKITYFGVLSLLKSIWFSSAETPVPNAWKEQGLIDWQSLMDASFACVDTTHRLPALVAFILNYAGSSNALSDLLEKILQPSVIEQHPEILAQLSQLMALFPKRDFSPFIFNAIEKVMVKNPALMTENIFNQLAIFHQTEVQTRNPDIRLLMYFAQKKQYALARRCAKLLLGVKEKRVVEDNRLWCELVINETTVEEALMHKQHRWYFPVYAWIKRFWNNTLNPCGIVRYCDDKTPPLFKERMLPQTIKTPVVSGEVITQQKEQGQVIKKLRTYGVVYQKEPGVRGEGVSPASGFGLFDVPGSKAALLEGGALKSMDASSRLSRM